MLDAPRQVELDAVVELAATDSNVVSTVEDGPAAVEAIVAEPFDILVLDDQMPRMTGAEAARIIRQMPGERGRVPMVVVTASALGSDRDELLDAGFDVYLAKPFQRDALVVALGDAGARRRQIAA